MGKTWLMSRSEKDAILLAHNDKCERVMCYSSGGLGSQGTSRKPSTEVCSVTFSISSSAYVKGSARNAHLRRGMNHSFQREGAPESAEEKNIKTKDADDNMQFRHLEHACSWESDSPLLPSPGQVVQSRSSSFLHWQKWR